jgi:hypothetical protein
MFEIYQMMQLNQPFIVSNYHDEVYNTIKIFPMNHYNPMRARVEKHFDETRWFPMPKN